MEKVFIYGIQDKIKLEALIKWYDQHSTTAAYIRNEVMTLYRTRKRSRFEVPSTWTNDAVKPLVQIVHNRPLEVAGSIITQPSD